MNEQPNLLTIGALSKATGVPADTLRTWERRYGFPAPERTHSGHRRYSMATLRRLKLIARLLESGHRASSVLSADDDTLLQLLASRHRERDQARPLQVAIEDDREAIEVWLGHVERYEGRAFERELRGSWAALGALPFLDRRLGPFVKELGSRWASGHIGVRHEHFASERVREFLVQLWRPLSDAATGTSIVLATLPGERHVLGLHMAALTLALANCRIVFLGADSPPEEIARTVEQYGAELVALSASAAADAEDVRCHIAMLRDALPTNARIVAGGAGFAAPPEGVEHVISFSDLASWAARG